MTKFALNRDMDNFRVDQYTVAIKDNCINIRPVHAVGMITVLQTVKTA